MTSGKGGPERAGLGVLPREYSVGNADRHVRLDVRTGSQVKVPVNVSVPVKSFGGLKVAVAQVTGAAVAGVKERLESRYRRKKFRQRRRRLASGAGENARDYQVDLCKQFRHSLLDMPSEPSAAILRAE